MYKDVIYMYIYIYIHTCVCVCVCVCIMEYLSAIKEGNCAISNNMDG